jgi:hypothetical protein
VQHRKANPQNIILANMSLDNKIKRREFLKLAGKGAGAIAIGSLPLISSGCKKGAETPDMPARDVSVGMTFYNHTQGVLGEQTYRGKSNQPFTISISELAFTNVDPLRIAVRKASNSETMGSFVGFSRTGSLTINYPEKNDVWEAYLMNSGSKARYEFIDYLADNHQGKLVATRDVTWERKDVNATGPEEPILEAFQEVNEALQHPWKKYGSFNKVDNGFGAVSVGYALLGMPSNSSFYSSWIRVDPTFCVTFEEKLKHFLNEIFNLFTYSPRLGGWSPYNTICEPGTGHLNAEGRDLMAYVYVKDTNY